MSKIRKLNQGTRLSVALFSTVVSIIFGAIGLSARNSIAAVPPGVELPAGTVVYDTTFTPVELPQAAVVTRSRTGQYFLEQEGADLPLGMHTLA